jgi:hypothetical protein
MSRLIDKFQNAAKSSPQPMGFRTSRTTVREPGFLLIVKTAPDALKNPGEIKSADAVLLQGDGEVPAAKNIGKIVESLGETPTGLYIENADDEEVSALAAAGIDFFVFPASAKVFTMPADKKIGRVIEVESAMDDSLLVAVNGLPVDAVMASDTFTGGAMSWHELMIFQHLANMFGKPLIARIPADISEIELKALWDAGVDGALVDEATLKAGGLKKLQEAIHKLPARASRKRGKEEVFLPRAGGTAQTAPPPDEEEEEEDE